jgi:hypothetical protein
MHLRTYGRVTDPASGARWWVTVECDMNDNPDSVYLTALIQTLKLNYGESPYFGNWGIPAHQSIMQQIFPDYYVLLTQKRYAPYFMTLGIVKQTEVDYPLYTVTVQFKTGAVISTTVIPQAVVDPYGQAIVDSGGYPTQNDDLWIKGKYAPV